MMRGLSIKRSAAFKKFDLSVRLLLNATIDLILQAVLLPFADASVRTLVTCGSLSSLGCMLDNHFLQ